MAYKTNIEADTVKNKYYRKVLFTTPQQQLVLMSLAPGESIGMESHPRTTQFIRVEKGRGVATVRSAGGSGESRYLLKDGDSITIPPGVYHDISASSGGDGLKLYTIYSPPEHPPNTLQKVKA